MATFHTKRIYDEVGTSDGYRVLIDRLWPRGVSKDRAKLDEWAKELAPSSQLRKWFGHDPKKYTEFKKKYRTELSNNSKLDAHIAEWKKHPTVTLLYGAKDTDHNEVVVLREYLTR